jgi:hypothetical protein
LGFFDPEAGCSNPVKKAKLHPDGYGCHRRRPHVFGFDLFMAAGCGTLDAQTSSVEDPYALMRRLEAQRVDGPTIFQAVSAPVLAEARDPRWAGAREAELDATFAQTPGLPGARLSGLDCRATGCVLGVALASNQVPEAAIEQRRAVTHWIAGVNPARSRLRRQTLHRGISISSRDATSSRSAVFYYEANGCGEPSATDRQRNSPGRNASSRSLPSTSRSAGAAESYG